MTQLQDYLQRLLTIEPAFTPEEQFNLLYTFRKWLLWVPPLLMKKASRNQKTLLVVAYFYATALRLDPLFPEVGNDLVALPVLLPLGDLLQLFGALQQRPAYEFQSSHELTQLLAFPREAMTSYQISHAPPPIPEVTFGPGFDDIFSNVDMSFGTLGSHNDLSPGMIPSFRPRGSVDSESNYSSDWSIDQRNQGSPFLGVPNISPDGQYYGSSMTTSNPQYFANSDETREMMRRSVDFQSGFVDFAPEIWT